MPKNEIAMISSIEDEAKMKEGIPLSIPNPFSCKSNKDGTTTAGLTAPKINPILYHIYKFIFIILTYLSLLRTQ